MSFEIKQTETFRRWHQQLRDPKALALIALRLQRLTLGHRGDSVAVGNGVTELRIHVGPGYRIYFIRWGTAMILLLCGGDKHSQASDIEKAKRLARDWRDENG